MVTSCIAPCLSFAPLLVSVECRRIFFRYSNFISSSDVITSVQGRTNMCDMLRIMGSDITHTSSPTSGHLTIILDLLTQLLKMVGISYLTIFFSFLKFSGIENG